MAVGYEADSMNYAADKGWKHPNDVTCGGESPVSVSVVKVTYFEASTMN